MKQRKRLKRIMALKERIRDARKAAVISARRAEDDAIAAVDDAKDEVERISGEFELIEEVAANELAHRGDMVASARRYHHRAVEQREEKTVERESQEEILVRASKEVRSLEGLDRRYAETERKEEARRERSESDEFAARVTRGDGL